MQTAAFEIEGNVIQALYVVRNPDKLRHLAAASTRRGQDLEKMRDDHPGSLSVGGVAIAKRTAEQFLLRAGAPGEGRNNAGQHDREGRPTAEGERFAHGEQYETEVDRVADEAIRAGCDEPRALIYPGHEAPGRAEFGTRSEDKAHARKP